MLYSPVGPDVDIVHVKKSPSSARISRAFYIRLHNIVKVIALRRVLHFVLTVDT